VACYRVTFTFTLCNIDVIIQPLPHREHCVFYKINRLTLLREIIADSKRVGEHRNIFSFLGSPSRYALVKYKIGETYSQAQQLYYNYKIVIGC
jgi:hypothetical protein